MSTVEGRRVDVETARELWAECILRMDEGPQRTRELRQMMIDAMDATQQSDDCERLVAALRAFDGAK